MKQSKEKKIYTMYDETPLRIPVEFLGIQTGPAVVLRWHSLPTELQKVFKQAVDSYHYRPTEDVEAKKDRFQITAQYLAEWIGGLVFGNQDTRIDPHHIKWYLLALKTYCLNHGVSIEPFGGHNVHQVLAGVEKLATQMDLRVYDDDVVEKVASIFEEVSLQGKGSGGESSGGDSGFTEQDG